MPETVNMLEQCIEKEISKFFEILKSMNKEELAQTAEFLSKIPYNPQTPSNVKDLVNIARNIKNVNVALEDFYVV